MAYLLALKHFRWQVLRLQLQLRQSVQAVPLEDFRLRFVKPQDLELGLVALVQQF